MGNACALVWSGSLQMPRVGAEGQHQTSHAEIVDGRLDPVLPALALDLLDAACELTRVALA